MAFGGYRAKHLPPTGSRRGRLLKAGDTFRIGECDKTFIVHLGMSQSAASASSAAIAEWHQIAWDRFRALTRSHGRCSWRTDRGFETEQHTQRRDVARRVASVPALARRWHWPGVGTALAPGLARPVRTAATRTAAAQHRAALCVFNDQILAAILPRPHAPAPASEADADAPAEKKPEWSVGQQRRNGRRFVSFPPGPGA